MTKLPQSYAHTHSLGPSLDFIYSSFAVQRFHTMRLLHTISVGEHSAGVALLAYTLMPTISAAGLVAALLHDVGEHVTGDIPSPFKRRAGIRDQVADAEAALLSEAGVPQFDLAPEEQRAIKLADSLDGLRHTIVENLHGNHCSDIARAERAYREYVESFAPLNDREQSVYNAILSLRSRNSWQKGL